MRSKFGTFCMTLGAVLVLAALSLFIRNQREAQEAADSVEEVMLQIHQRINNPAPDTAGPDNSTADTSVSDVSDLLVPAASNPFDIAMTEVEIDGYSYIGYLSIPILDLELPVMSEWDYPHLKVAPCRYS